MCGIFVSLGLGIVTIYFNFIQRALVLEDYAPALGCGGLLVGRRVQEVRGKKRRKGKIIIINKKLTGKINMTVTLIS